nr:LGFP repeat-containing protein [Mycolicibacterium rutilum]
MATALLTGAAALLLSPAAGATPESDADAAITAAWDASGGAGGPLGPEQGEVYRAGDGFAQNYSAGKIFFTPQTGAHFVRGAILEKYESLGGPADSDLGFPTIDDGPGRAPGSFNTTFSAADKPVIFWTADTGARVVRGPINAAWDKLGGSSGVLGVPADDESYRGDLVTQKFTGGELTYNTREKTFTTVPPDLAGQLAGLKVPDDPTSAINAARRAAGGALGPLGAAEGPPYKIGADGLGQNFAGGKIFYSPATGARVVTGQVLTKYESLGGPEGDLGFPTSGEEAGGAGEASRMSTFAAEDNPVIFWTPDYGAVLVRGPMRAAWDKLDGAEGTLGAPMADQTESDGVLTQRFSGGVVSWDRATGDFSTEPANLASQLSDLQVPGRHLPDTPAAPQPSAADDSGGFGWSWWWLLAIVPVLILVGLVVFATMRSRRRDDDHPGFDDDRFDDGYGSDVDRIYSTVGAREPDVEEMRSSNDDYAAALFGDRYASEGLGALGPESSSPWEPPPESGPADEPVEHVVDPYEAPEEQPAREDNPDDNPDDIVTAPTRIQTLGEATAPERDPLTDTGRHARIEVDKPEIPGPAFRLSLDDAAEGPEGYPIKADTQSGRYWLPGSADYDDAHAEIWFSSEEFARTNGFVRAD